MKKIKEIFILGLIVFISFNLIAQALVTDEVLEIKPLNPGATIGITAEEAKQIMPIANMPVDCSLQVSPLKFGWQGEEVRQLQSVLGKDKTIYPEGLATGYFGKATENAVKRLQEKYSLPQTGVVDQNLRQIILPCGQIIKVVYPNGGEVFRSGEEMKISWQVNLPRYQWQELQPGQRVLGVATNTAGVIGVEPINPPPFLDVVKPMPQTVSVDLVEEVSSPCPATPGGKTNCLVPISQKLIFHIKNFVLKDDNIENTIVWKIPSNFPESSNYKIRVTSWGAFNKCSFGEKCLMMPDNSPITGDSAPQIYDYTGHFDLSDGVFKILGNKIQPTPLPTILPSTTSPDLVRMRNEVVEMMKKLQILLEQLNKLLGL